MSSQSDSSVGPSYTLVVVETNGTYHEIANYYGGQEERHAHLGRDPHAVPHRLDPLSAEAAEDDHKAVHAVDEVPARHLFGRESVHVV